MTETPVPPDDPATTTPRGRPYIHRLHNAHGIRRELAALYRAARLGDVDPGDASKLGSLLGLMLRAVETTDIEQALAEIENRKKDTNRNRP